MGDEQRVPPDELIAQARARFESATDFTIAVEEEFAILDPSSLDLTSRFEDVQAAAHGTNLQEHLVGELIASEVEVRTGRQESFADVPAAMAERRAQLRSLVEPMGLLLGATGTHPWADWKKQRIIDTPHYRRNDELLRYVVWRNNTFGLHVHVAVNGPDRAIAVVAGMRNFLPELLALSASSPFVEGVNSGLHSEHTQIWWSVRPHLAFPTVEIRICDGQPELAEAQSLAALAASLVARVARAYDEGATVELLPHRLIEENFWRAIRWGLSGELIDFARGESIPARQRLEELIEWVQPVAEEIGAAPYLAVPEQNAAERQIERFEGGASLEEIYGEQVRATEAIGG
jgi:glutamate---cysteine ligase / carboxylate-amine ligase